MVSVGIHCAAVIVLFAVKFTVLDKPKLQISQVSLVAPATPPAPPPKRAVLRTPPPPKQLALPVLAKRATPVLQMPAPPLIQPPAPKPPVVPERLAEAPPVPVAPRPVVQTDVFSSIAKSAPSQPVAAKVETGAFSAAGAAAPHSDKNTQIVAAGFGEAAVAPTAGSRRIASTGGAGFSEATVAYGSGAPARRGVTNGTGFGDAGVAAGPGPAVRSVRASNFGDTVAAAPTAATKQIVAAPTTSAQILEKPRPVYTDEARRLGIEGEVQIEVRFRATGEVEIVRVVRGLGHGLDESAAKAARTIRFLPAKRDGQPVDSTATVHITFQLAS